MNLKIVAEEASRIGGNTARKLFSHASELAEIAKGGQGRDIATLADKQAEEAIVTFLREHTPDIPIVGEEKENVQAELEAERRWVVDPVDGSTNFKKKSWMWGTTVALIQESQPYLGAIYLPMQGQMLVAERDQGCWLNNIRLRLDMIPSTLEECVVGIEYGYWLCENNNRKYNQLGALVSRCRGVHSLLAATGDMIELTQGITQLYINLGSQEVGAHLWDFAAGVVAIGELLGEHTYAKFASSPDGSPLSWSGLTTRMEIVMSPSSTLKDEAVRILTTH